MRNHRQPTIKPSEIADERAYLNRRQLLSAGLAVSAALALPRLSIGADNAALPGKALTFTRNENFSVKDAPTSYGSVTSYNNFYEFGTDKAAPAKNAHTLKTAPWSVEIAGEAEVTGRFTLEDILKPHALQERVYRLRCVEGWSMVVPWVGFPLGDLLQRFKPTSRAKYVAFKTLHDPRQMPGQRTDVLDWPYEEGLRMDEAMHPLALLAVGLYGRTLPNQNGAPLRLVVPWKYGFKGIKSIVQIRFTEREPRTSWNISAPQEYGFYANVNPEVDHPRWSQAKERVIGSSSGFGGGLFDERKPTLMFNGYAEQVAHLYKGMNLRRYY